MVISFDNRSDANNAVYNKLFQDSRFSINIPLLFLYRKVIIKGIPTDVSNDELWEELESSNASLVFDKEDIYRMRVRKFVGNEIKYVDSTAVKLN